MFCYNFFYNKVLQVKVADRQQHYYRGRQEGAWPPRNFTLCLPQVSIKNSMFSSKAAQSFFDCVVVALLILLNGICSFQEKFILDNHLNSMFIIYYHKDRPSWGGVHFLSPNQDSQHPMESPFSLCNLVQRNTNTIPVYLGNLLLLIKIL